MFYLGMEDLTANALIEILKQQTPDFQESTFVTYAQLEEYGMEVTRILLEEGDEAVFILSRDNTNALFFNYADFFEEKDSPNGLGVALKDGVSLPNLISTFRGYLPWSVLRAFSDERSIAKLKVAA